MDTKNIFIVGASRGLGDAFSRGLAKTGDCLWLLSRNKPGSLELQDGIKRIWIQADLSRQGVAQMVATELSKSLNNQALDACIYNAGIWEENAFGNHYSFEKTDDQTNQEILQVNLVAAVAITKVVLPLMQKAINPKIILIGSTNGLPNTGMPEVAYSASKWGLRGVAHALRESSRTKNIAVSIINPGSLGDVIHGAHGEVLGAGIPCEDLIVLTNCILNMSNRSVVKEVHMPAMLDLFA